MRSVQTLVLLILQLDVALLFRLHAIVRPRASARSSVSMCAGDECPTEVRLYKNMEVGFDTDAAPTQTLRLGPDPAGELEMSVVAPKFNDCRTLSLFFPESVGGDKTRIYYIGLLGDHVKPQEKLTGVVYESKPQLKDHETRADQAGSNNLGM